jgi:16S rRNA (uracil1498-N3)-methyltransferase
MNTAPRPKDKVRLFYPHPIQIGQTLLLSVEHSHYLHHVLRLKYNDPIILFTPEGGDYQASLQRLNNKKQWEIHIDNLAIHLFPPTPFLHLCQGLARPDRMDWIIQKSTECGVDSITPLHSDHTQIPIKAAALPQRLKHWQKIAISAAEQCGRITIPHIYPPITLEQKLKALAKEKDAIHCFFIDPTSASPLSTATLSHPAPLYYFIGPEGGFSAAERQEVLEQGIPRYHLGPRILRTETASIVTIALLQSLFGDSACCQA